MKKIYLGVPYSFNPNFSFRLVNKVAAQLMQKGHVVFSPISHSHNVADHLPDGVRTDSRWWDRQNFPYIDHWADEGHFIVIGEKGLELIENSIGCTAELNRFTEKRKPFYFIEVDEHGNIISQPL